MPNPQRITIDPDPPVQGQSVTVCYDFAGTALQKVDLVLSYTPSGTVLVTVTPAAPCAIAAVPGNATSLKIVDLTGTSPPLVVEI